MAIKEREAYQQQVTDRFIFHFPSNSHLIPKIVEVAFKERLSSIKRKLLLHVLLAT